MEFLVPNPNNTYCEWKGMASYLDLVMGSDRISGIGWYYVHPKSPYAALKDHFAFYSSKLDACYVNDELVESQEGDFYGGWITSNIKGPFKGAAGTYGW